MSNQRSSSSQRILLRKIAIRILSVGLAVIAGLVVTILCRLIISPMNVGHIFPALERGMIIQQADRQHEKPVLLKVRKLLIFWPIFRKGDRFHLDINIDDLQLSNGEISDNIAHANLQIPIWSLLQGKIIPTNADIRNASLHLLRDKNAHIGMTAFFPFAKYDNSLFDISVVRNIDIKQSIIEYTDEETMLSMNTTINTLVFRKSCNSLPDLTMDANVTANNKTIPITVQTVSTSPLGKREWSFATGSFLVNELSQLPFSTPLELKLFKLPVALRGTITANPSKGSWQRWPAQGFLTVEVGKGTVTTKDSTLQLEEAAFSMAVDVPDGVDSTTSIDITKGDIKLSPPSTYDKKMSLSPMFHITGQAKIADFLQKSNGTFRAEVKSKNISFASLADYWPQILARGAHNWVTNNITSGIATNLHADMTFGFSVSEKRVNLSAVQAYVDAKDLKVRWLPTVPLFFADRAKLSMNDPDKIHIQFSGRQQVQRSHRRVGATGIGWIAVPVGTLDIDNLQEANQMARIAIHQTGNLRDFLALLAEPRLRLLSRHPQPFLNPYGNAKLDINISLPLISHVTIEEVSIRGHAKLSNVHLGKVLWNNDFSQGNLVVDADNDGMTIKGTGLLGRMVSRVIYTMDFRTYDQKHVIDTMILHGVITPRVLYDNGVALARYIRGSARMDVNYRRYSDASSKVNTVIDLTQAELDTPIWYKSAGLQSSLSLGLSLKNDHIDTIDKIHMSGSDLSLQGEVGMIDGHPRLIRFNNFRLGHSIGNANLVLSLSLFNSVHEKDLKQSNTICVEIDARTFDLSPYLHHMTQPRSIDITEDKDKGSGSRNDTTTDVFSSYQWEGRVRADRIYYDYDKNKYFGNVTAKIHGEGSRLDEADITIYWPTVGKLVLTPDKTSRHPYVAIADLGLMLKQVGLTENIKGGQIVLKGEVDGSKPGLAFKGKLSTGPFVIRDAPVVLRAISRASLYGWLGARQAPEFAIDNFKLDLLFSQGVLTVNNGHANNGSVGATIRGTINPTDNMINLQGTVVPAFFINRLPGRLPFIGWLLSPEEDGGLLALDLTIKGPIDDPIVKINPLSIIMPGILRRLIP